jgi:hypothetical protein
MGKRQCRDTYHPPSERPVCPLPTERLPALDHGRIRIAGVLVYIERTLRSARPLPPGALPRPYGLASTALDRTGEAVAAVSDDEAVWLGFQAIDEAQPVILRIRVGVEQPLDALSGEPWNDKTSSQLRCPPEYALPGLRRSDGFLPFNAGQTITVLIDASPVPAEVIIRLLSPALFSRVTGTTPTSLDPDSAFKGYRLP